jgi:hypothetical protein
VPASVTIPLLKWMISATIFGMMFMMIMIHAVDIDHVTLALMEMVVYGQVTCSIALKMGPSSAASNQLSLNNRYIEQTQYCPIDSGCNEGEEN